MPTKKTAKKPVKKTAKKTTKKVAAKSAVLTSKIKSEVKKEMEGLTSKTLWKDPLKMFFNPKAYFSAIRENGNFESPMIKVAMYGFITALLKIILNLSSITLVNAITTLILTPIGAVILGYSLSGILLMFSYLCKGEMRFETAFKAVASKMFLYPVAYLLYAISFNYYMLWTVSLLIDAYIVTLAYFAVLYCLKGSAKISKMVWIAFLILIILVHFSESGLFWVASKNPGVALGHHISSSLGKSVNFNF